MSGHSRWSQIKRKKGIKDEQKAYYRPISTVSIQSPHEAARILTLVDTLENLDDVYKVYTNFDIPDELIMVHKYA